MKRVGAVKRRKRNRGKEHTHSQRTYAQSANTQCSSSASSTKHKTLCNHRTYSFEEAKSVKFACCQISTAEFENHAFSDCTGLHHTKRLLPFTTHHTHIDFKATANHTLASTYPLSLSVVLHAAIHTYAFHSVKAIDTTTEIEYSTASSTPGFIPRFAFDT